MSTETPKGDRIAKVLARAGLASRRDAERMIADGRVSVNGKVINSPALNVSPKDKIVCDGKAVGEPEPPRLWMYNKPTGLVTSARDEKGRDTVFDHLPEDMPRVVSVGRLDLNSEGLMLLTNDGEIKRKLELPSTGWVRKYRVRVKGEPNDDVIEPIRKGITIDGERFQPMAVSIDRQKTTNAWLTISLREGKNREIRRALEAVGLEVNRLIRVSYGPFQLGELQSGEVQEIKTRIMRDQLGMAPLSLDDTGTATKKLVRGPRKPAGGKPGGPRPTGTGPTGARTTGPTGPRAYAGKTGAAKAGAGKAFAGRTGGTKPANAKPWDTKPEDDKPTGRKPGGPRPARKPPTRK
ncbi:pseudouridine synthase [Pseudogemmobacter sp. W21_MBD1_M6]|uniref:pseudouridine synthase n=1 Tax=Pseudogemmobacter sp. W21_MBD1_M6 TaxID=3240271 RepID=UPI003F9A8920